MFWLYKRFMLCLLCFMLGIQVPSQAGAREIVDSIVAVVNGEIITLYELNDRLEPFLRQLRAQGINSNEEAVVASARKKLLEQMIDDILLKQEIEKYELKVSDTEVENEVQRLMQRSGLSQDAFEAQLRLQGSSLVELKQKVRSDILKYRLLGGKVRQMVVVSEEELLAYYNSHKSEYDTGSFVELSVILVEDEKQAISLKKDIEKKKITFAEAAEKYSQGPGAGQGGSLGKMPRADITPDWQTALAGLEPGEISSPFSFRDFFILLRLDDETSGDKEAFSKVRDEIYDKLYKEQLQKRFETYMEQLKTGAVIESRL